MAQMVKNLPAMWKTWVQSLDWEDPHRDGNGNPLQYSGLENSMDRGYSPWSHKKSDMTEQLTHKGASLMTSHQTQFCATYQRDCWVDAIIATQTHCSILCVHM